MFFKVVLTGLFQGLALAIGGALLLGHFELYEGLASRKDLCAEAPTSAGECVNPVSLLVVDDRVIIVAGAMLLCGLLAFLLTLRGPSKKHHD